VPDVQRNRSRVLTDRLQCPDCGGTGRQVIGPLQMACRFCSGQGYVGGDNEPAKDHNGDSHPIRPVWQEPAARTLTVCRVCFGAKKVVNLGGTGEPTGYLIEMPCPECSRQDDQADEQ
jgi:RecJ-like exonuclease